MKPIRDERSLARSYALLLASATVLVAGCYAPLRSPGIQATALPDDFRFPVKAMSSQLNYAMLTREVPDYYLLGPNDIIRVEIADLVPKIDRLPPIEARGAREASNFSHVGELQVSQRGEIMLPLVGAVDVANLTLQQAQEKIQSAYADGYLDQPRVSVILMQKSMTRVMVMGAVLRPDLYELPKFENDIAHAVTMAGGIADDGAMEIQRHRREPVERLPGNSLLAPPELANSAQTSGNAHTRNFIEQLHPTSLGTLFNYHWE